MVIKRNIFVVLLLTLLGVNAGAQMAPAIPELIEVSDAELQTGTGVKLAAALNSYRSQLGQDDTQALEAAKQVIALSVQLWGESDTRVSQALTNLAIAQGNVGNHDIARDNFLASIRVAETATNNIVTPSVVNPLRGLATALVALDSAEMAIPVFQRAIHISHVNEGPNNLSQIPVMEALSRAHFFAGQLSEADSLQENIFRLQQRQLDEGSDEYLDAMKRRARWYTRTENFAKATDVYRRIERVISTGYGPTDVRLVEPLLELSFVAPRQQPGEASAESLSAVKEGQRAAARAVKIARLNSAAHPGLLARTLTREGDWYMSTGLRRNARTHYSEAWELMNADPALHDLRDQLFSRPVLVVAVRMDPVFGETTDDAMLVRNRPLERGFVELGFDVNEYGKPIDIELLDSEPSGIMESHVIRRLRRHIYRPVFADGDPVSYGNMVLRHEFRYDEDNLTDKQKAAIKEARRERAAKLEAGSRESAAETGE